MIPGVDVTWTQSYSGLWYDFLDTYGYYIWESDSDYINNLSITQISFNSELSEYIEKIEFAYDNRSISFPVSAGDTIYITSVNNLDDYWQIDFEFATSLTDFYDQITVYTTGVYVRLYDSRYDPDGLSYELGYRRGKIDGREEFIDNELPDINSANYNNGYQNAYNEYYSARYQEGYSDAQTEGPALISYIPGILGVVIGFFFQIASIQFAGVSILKVLVAVFGITVALLLFKIFLGGK